MIVAFEEVFRDGLTGTDSAYTPLSEAFARAERFFAYVRVSQITAAGVSITVDLEASNDAVTWASKKTLVNGLPLDESIRSTNRVAVPEHLIA